MKIWKGIFKKIVSLFYPEKANRRPFPFTVSSSFLSRDVFSHLYLPINQNNTWSLLLLNDGQDEKLLDLLKAHKPFRKTPNSMMIVAIHAGDRLAEYGTSELPDYKGRGQKSTAYQNFIIKELLPELREKYPISIDPHRIGIAGFSLGGLSAIDIAWEHPKVFGFAGIFSGALWWRKTPFNAKDPDADRIIHEKVSLGTTREQRFWFQVGTNDETSDRNNNGVIDAIDDTIDLMNLLKDKIPIGERYLKYEAIKNGEHNQATWKKVLPHFLDWIYK